MLEASQFAREAAATAFTGDFEKAVAETSRVLAVRGLVLPSTMATSDSRRIGAATRCGRGVVVQPSGRVSAARTW